METHTLNSQNGPRMCAYYSASRAALNLIIITVLVVSSTGCSAINSLKDALGFGESSVDRTLKIIDDAIARLDNESADWQTVLQDMQAQLTSDAQSTIRNEVTQLIQRSVEAVSSNVKCIIDLVRTRVKQDLLRIRSELLNIPVPPVEPFICTSVPSAVDMSLPANKRNLVELYGFDFDTNTKPQILLQDTNRTVDVSQFLDRPTHYLMTLNLGASGIPVNKNSQKLVLNWQSKEIATIAVIQPQTPICQTKSAKFTPAAVTYLPPRIGHGDADYNGHGPRVTVNVSLQNLGNKIGLKLFMDARETKSDWTEAGGSLTKDIYVAPQGWRIDSLDSPRSDDFHYIDTNHAPENFSGGGPVKLFVIVGDTDGADAGRSTKVDVSFNELRMTLRQVGNCVSASNIVEAVGQNEISTETLKRLRSSISADWWKQLSPDNLKNLSPGLRDLMPTLAP
jgi:hypothetical protein